MTFACDVADHCEAGQVVTFNIQAASRPEPGTGGDGTPPTRPETGGGGGGGTPTRPETGTDQPTRPVDPPVTDVVPSTGGDGCLCPDGSALKTTSPPCEGGPPTGSACPPAPDGGTQPPTTGGGTDEPTRPVDPPITPDAPESPKPDEPKPEETACPDGTQPVSCFSDPCSSSTCPAKPRAQCKANYCGGCNAVWFVGTTQLSADDCTVSENPSGTDEPVCCMAMTAECLACSARKTKEEYCEGMPTTVGCTDGVSEDSCRDCMAEMQDATRCADKCSRGTDEPTRPDQPPVRPGQGGEGEDGPPAFMSCVQDQLEPYLEAQDTLGLAKFACEDAKLDTAACSSADRVLVDGEIKELCALTACTSCMEVSRNPRDCAEKCAGVEEDEDRPRPASDPPPQTAEDVRSEEHTSELQSP